MSENQEPTEQHRIKVEKYVETIPVHYRKAYLRSALGKPSKADMRRMRCLTCVNFEEPVVTVRECRAFICDNWKHRPYKFKS